MRVCECVSTLDVVVDGFVCVCKVSRCSFVSFFPLGAWMTQGSVVLLRVCC